MPVVDCGELINGSRCHKDHSSLVCNSGIAYCLAARTHSSSKIGEIDVMEPTLPYCQDIIVNKHTVSRVFWDDGSSRVLINNDFAKENNLRSRPAAVTMKVVGDVKKMDVMIYELDLQDMYGKQHSIWGYGIDHIMDPDEPVDLSSVKSLFPHVPDRAFFPLPKRRIDILIGLNYNSLHPYGGTGVDIVGNLKALRSSFGCGWVIGGCHKDLKVVQPSISCQAASARIAKVSVIPELSDADKDTTFLLDQVKSDPNAKCGSGLPSSLLQPECTAKFVKVFVDPQAVQKIIENIYVDDGVTGGNPEDVRRMNGIRGSEGKHHGGTISKILAKGNFAVKKFDVDGDTDQAKENLLDYTVFGYEWDTHLTQIKGHAPHADTVKI